MTTAPATSKFTQTSIAVVIAGAAPCSAKWSWDTNISFQNIGRRPAICENHGCGAEAAHIVEDINSYSWACANCTPLIPNGVVVWPNDPSSPTAADGNSGAERKRWQLKPKMERTKRAAVRVQRVVVPLYNEHQLEMWEGRPHYLHMANCPNYCDYACNGQRGFAVADRIAAERELAASPERHND